MTLGEVLDLMNQAGAVRMNDIYPEPWTQPKQSDGSPSKHGYRVGFLLRDQTAIMVEVEAGAASIDEKNFKVVGFEIGPPGEDYKDKIAWNRQKEWHRFPVQFDLRAPHAPQGKFDDVQPKD
jgi:hypothetical protein